MLLKKNLHSQDTVKKIYTLLQAGSPALMSPLSAARLMTHFCVRVTQPASESTDGGGDLRGLDFSNLSMLPAHSAPAASGRQQKNESWKIVTAPCFVLTF